MFATLPTNPCDSATLLHQFREDIEGLEGNGELREREWREFREDLRGY